MISKRIICLCLLATQLTLVGLPPVVWAQERWSLGQTFTVAMDELPVYRVPGTESEPDFHFYKGMTFVPNEEVDRDGTDWLRVGSGSFWVPAIGQGGKVNLSTETVPSSSKIVDLYGILDQPHRYAVKMVKMQGAKARIETYRKTADGYVLNYTYDATYRKDGPKEKYGDLKTPGGPVVRYLYRTTRSAMDGRDKSGAPFGVFKVSYPMPHDALPDLLSGKMSVAEYNKIPAINYVNGTLEPHPHGMLGADILIHTQRWGSLGCVNIENEAMSFLYNNDLVTENDKEIIPFIIYDENVEAPPIGKLF